MAFGDDDDAWAEDISLLITTGSDITPYELAELMHDAYFSASDDAEADSYQTQSGWYRRAAESTALELLASAEEAMLANIRNAVHQGVVPCVSPACRADAR